MRKFVFLFCTFCMIVPSTSFAQQATNIPAVVVNSLLNGCLPNAMGLLPFIPASESKLNSSGIAIGSSRSLEDAMRLSPVKSFALASPILSPDNVLLVSTPTHRMCAIGIYGSDPAPIRAALQKELATQGSPWKQTYNEALNGILMETYEWQVDSNNRFAINISGPDKQAVTESLQLMIRVAQIK